MANNEAIMCLHAEIIINTIYSPSHFDKDILLTVKLGKNLAAKNYYCFLYTWHADQLLLFFNIHEKTKISRSNP